LVSLFLVGIYLNFTIFKLPSPLAGVAGLALLIVNLHRARKAEVIVVLGFLALACFSILGRALATSFDNALTTSSSDVEDILFEQFLSVIVFLYALVISYGAYLELRTWNSDALHKVFNVAILVILFGVTLENFTPFKEVSDSFRDVMYTRVTTYYNDARDIAQYGMVRPKLFSSEPSYVGTFLFFCLVGWLLSATSPNRLHFYLVLVIGFISIRSPVILLAALAPLVHVFANQRDRWSFRRLLILGAATVLLIPAIYLLIEATMMPRVQAMLDGSDSSTFRRLVIPLRMMVDVLSDHPLLGLGFGAKESAFGYMQAIMTNSNSVYIQNLDVTTLGNLGHSFVFGLAMQLGFPGFFIFVTLLWQLFKVFCVHQRLLVAFALVSLMQVTGATNSVLLWPCLFILFAAGVSRRVEHVAFDRLQVESHDA